MLRSRRPGLALALAVSLNLIAPAPCWALAPVGIAKVDAAVPESARTGETASPTVLDVEIKKYLTGAESSRYSSLLAERRVLVGRQEAFTNLGPVEQKNSALAGWGNFVLPGFACIYVNGSPGQAAGIFSVVALIDALAFGAAYGGATLLKAPGTPLKTETWLWPGVALAVLFSHLPIGVGVGSALADQFNAKKRDERESLGKQIAEEEAGMNAAVDHLASLGQRRQSLVARIEKAQSSEDPLSVDVADLEQLSPEVRALPVFAEPLKGWDGFVARRKAAEALAKAADARRASDATEREEREALAKERAAAQAAKVEQQEATAGGAVASLIAKGNLAGLMKLGAQHKDEDSNPLTVYHDACTNFLSISDAAYSAVLPRGFPVPPADRVAAGRALLLHCQVENRVPGGYVIVTKPSLPIAMTGGRGTYLFLQTGKDLGLPNGSTALWGVTATSRTKTVFVRGQATSRMAQKLDKWVLVAVPAKPHMETMQMVEFRMLVPEN